MRLLLYEFVTGGGWYSADEDVPPGSLIDEGRAMLAALAQDFAAIDGIRVDVLADVRFGELPHGGVTTHAVLSRDEELSLLQRLCCECDAALLIAPEFDGHLSQRTRLVEQHGGRLLSPGSLLVEHCSDKQATAEHLSARGVPVPRGVAIDRGQSLPRDFDYPAVLKPRAGAGSLGIELMERWPEGRRVDFPARLEAYVPGIAASVACLCGPGQIVPLAPCLQRLAGGGDFSYQGGSLPIDSQLAERATRLAVSAIRSLPSPLGYLGVDLVLGSDSRGSGDVVIEINPRLTTSYVGLRRLARTNLAAAMIDVARGRAVELCWKSAAVQFSSVGECGETAATDSS